MRVHKQVLAYHRTTAEIGDATLRDGFIDSEGRYGTDEPHRGVCVTIDRPWDLVVAGPPPGTDLALLVVGVPYDLVVEHEWIEEDKGYREALIPAEELNRYPAWRAWECVECEAVAPAGSPGWRH